MAYPSYGYNIFARELEAALRARGARIGQLNDHPQLHLHPQLVHRLQVSLTHLKPLVILNPEDLEHVIEVYNMHDDANRLKAAVLATAVERVLMDRIEASTALMAANTVMHILREALQNNPDLIHVRGDELFLIETSEPINAIELALDTYDAGILELYLIDNTTPLRAATRIHQAIQYFLDTLEQLSQCPEEDQHSDTWQYWHDETNRALKQARELLNGGN